MLIKVNKCAFDSSNTSTDQELVLKSTFERNGDLKINLPDTYAYPPLINSHDHLVGNWVPKAGKNHPYPTTDIWVEEMKTSSSYLERNKIWENDGKFQLHKGNARLLTSLGIYKNIFSGCNAVHDHAPNQIPSYYKSFPIEVPADYRQCHSISLGNWWGGNTAREEWEATKGKMPFILHLAEGTNEKAKKAFGLFEKQDLLQSNTLIIHGIALKKDEIRKCARAGTSICCCPESNLFLIGRTIDIKACIEYGVNLVIGTDSTMSGSPNILTEIKIFHNKFPDIPSGFIFRCITENASRALMLNPKYGKLSSTTSELLLLRKKTADIFDNLLISESIDIELLIHSGKPIYGDLKYLDYFELDKSDYFTFNSDGVDRFVIGHPERTTARIDQILGYHKPFPYLPFR